MNVLVLMAGGSEAYAEAGHHYPKNLVEIAGKPIVQHVLESLHPLLQDGARLIVMVGKEEAEGFHTPAVIRLLVPDAEVRVVPGPTSGALCTALLAIELINSEQPLLIVNGDQLITADLRAAIREFTDRTYDGGILVFRDIHPRWSFVKRDTETGLVIETAEKRPISDLATAGCYFFRRGQDFVEAAQRTMLKDAAVGGRFFVCPSYNEMILDAKRVGVFEIAKAQYISLATPQGAQRLETVLGQT